MSLSAPEGQKKHNKPANKSVSGNLKQFIFPRWAELIELLF